MEDGEDNNFIAELFDANGRISGGVSEHLMEYGVKRVCQTLLGFDPSTCRRYFLAC